MNKIIKASVILMALVLVLVAFASCEKECVHQGGEATCTAKAVCELCGTEYGELAAHKEVYSSGLDATCTEPGYTVGMKCSVCNEVFVAVQPISPTGHSMEEKEAVSATCSSVGYTAHKECAVCGATEDKNEIPMLEHTLEDVEGLDATCTEDGYTAHQKCSVCKAEVGKEVIPATHALVDVEEKAATCTEEGYTAHKACSNCDYTEGKEVLAAAGHSLVDVEGKASTCTVAGYTAHKACSNCDYTEGKEDLELAKHIDTDLDITCDFDGCTKRILPEADSKISLFTANKMIIVSLNSSYYVEGTVTEVIDALNGIFIITDDVGDQLYIRMPVDANGVTHSNWEIKVVVGDVVSIYGKPKGTSGWNTDLKAGIQSGVLTFIKQHDHDYSAVEADCFNAASCICGKASSEGPKAHIDADTNDICDNCGYAVGSKMDFTKTHFSDVKETSNYDSVNGTALWESNEFSVLISKGRSTFNSNGSNHFRLQKDNILTITAKNGNKIAGIIFTVTTNSYTDELEYILTGLNIPYTINGLELTVKVDNLDTFVIDNTVGKIARIASVTVIYVPAASAE